MLNAYVIQNSFAAIKISLVLHLSNSPFSPSGPGNHISFYSLCNFAYFRMSSSWTHALRSLFRVPSFTEKYAFKIPSCLFMIAQFLLSLNNNAV